MVGKVMVFDHAFLIETTGHSSKGNQLKWKAENKWYKADHMGYEGLSEVLISKLLKMSNAENYVRYDRVDMSYHERLYHGCYSENFLSDSEELITVSRLYRQYTGRDFSKELAKIQELQERIVFFTDVIEEVTGLRHFGSYMAVGLTIDTFFFNEDRHLNNIAVIYNAEAETYRLCPYYDHGLSLFSDLENDFPLTRDIEECRKVIQAKPFDRDFDRQLDAAEELYGQNVKFSFGIKDIQRELADFEGIYEADILRRVEETLRYQIAKYQYLFV